MKRLFYGVAVSALVIGTGGAAMACSSHDHSAALKNPAAATQAATMRGVLLAQTQSDEDKSATTGEESKDKSEALPSKAIGPLAQSQDDADKEKVDEDKPAKPEATPGRAGNMILAQVQQDDATKEKMDEDKSATPEAAPSQDEQSGTTGESTDEDSKPDSEEQK
jgi:hypothetical protein